MAKKKNSMALFEVLSKQRASGAGDVLGLPDWIKNKPAGAEQEQAQAEQPTEAEETAEEAAAEETFEAEPGEDTLPEETVVTDEDVEIVEDEALEEEPEAEPEAVEAEIEVEPQDDEEDAIIDVEAEVQASPEEEEEEEEEETPPEAEEEEETEEALDAETAEADRTQEQEQPAEALSRPEADEEQIATEAEPAAEDETLFAPPEVPAADDMTTEEAQAPASGRRSPWPVLRIQHDRLHISVDVVLGMVILGALLMLLVLAFALGYLAAPNGGESSANQAGVALRGEVRAGDGPNIQPPDGGQGPSDPPALPADRPVTAQRGQRADERFYLLIQIMPGADDADKGDAQWMQEWFAEHDIPADIWQTEAGKKRLVWSLMGFARPGSEEARAHLKRVRELREEFFRNLDRSPQRLQKMREYKPTFVPGSNEPEIDNAND